MLDKFRRSYGSARRRSAAARHRARSLTTSAREHTRRLQAAATDRTRRLLAASQQRTQPLVATAGRTARQWLATATATRRNRSLLAAAAVVVLAGGIAFTTHAMVAERAPAGEVAGPAAPEQDVLSAREDDATRPDRGERDPGTGTEDDGQEPAGEESDSSARATGPDEAPAPESSPDESAGPDDDGGADGGSEPEASPEPEEQPDWVHPMPGARTTSCYGLRWGALHAGVDLALPHGTPIRAVGAGTVTEAGWVFGGYGISVVIDHGDGDFTHYAHASETRVSPGDTVEPGQIIALEGSTGESTGPHLHFEVHRGMWNQLEPTEWMANRGVTIGGC